ncbi:MAG: hypothetical protein QOH54_1266 [Mycobacterium sp.]|jgi:hypothetical protein|nr:hypothetical protein [Mycobacterium sp.]
MDTSTQDFKVHENRLRRAAHRQGLRLVKNRRRDPRAHDYGTYALVFLGKRALVCGANLSIDEVADYLARVPRRGDVRMIGGVVPIQT